MKRESSSHYIILGAGAVGGTMGALLAESGQRVTLIGRPALVSAVRAQGGLRHVRNGIEHLVPLAAVDHPGRVNLEGPVILFITTKAGDLDDALESARGAFPKTTLTVTWQNGIRAEDQALPVFPNLLGGIVRATSTMIVPGEVRTRSPGLLILGRTPPPGRPCLDPELDHVVRDLTAAGFEAVPSPDIRADKALKLLLNLISGASPLVRREGLACPNLTRLEQAVLIEGARILKAAGVPAYAASGRGEDVPTMLRHLAGRPVRPPIRDGVHNSTWQNLRVPGRRLENGHMNGEIVELAASIGRAAPWNIRLLDLLTEVHGKGLGPEALTDEELGARIDDLPMPPPWSAEDDPEIPGRS